MLQFQKRKNIGSLTSILLVLIKKKECSMFFTEFFVDVDSAKTELVTPSLEKFLVQMRAENGSVTSDIVTGTSSCSLG